MQIQFCQVSMFGEQQCVKKLIRDCFVLEDCVVSLLCSRYLKDCWRHCFGFFCHCVDDVCWICKTKFLLEVVLLWDMMLNSLCSSRCPKHLFVGDLFFVISNACQWWVLEMCEFRTWDCFVKRMQVLSLLSLLNACLKKRSFVGEIVL